MEIPVQRYLNHALSLKAREQKLISEFSEWLPEEVIDCHVHTNTKNHCVDINPHFRNHAMTTFPWFEIKDHLVINNILYPGIRTKILVFAFPYKGINHQGANEYIVSEAVHQPGIFPALYGIPDDIEYTISRLESGVFYGLKMYAAYTYPSAEKITDYFPEEILSFWETHNGTIILHPPSPITNCADEILSIAKKFSRLRIVIPHMGLTYFPSDKTNGIFAKLSEQDNIFLDSSFVTSVEVIKMALDIFGHTRILFGTDQPLSLIRGRFYRNPNLGSRIATDYPYHWVDQKEQKEFSSYSKNVIHFHWEMLLALRETIKSYGETDEVKSCIFAKNTERVFNLDRQNQHLD